MTESDFRELLERCQAGAISPDAAWQTVQSALSPTAIVREAMVDLDRHQRCGYPEVVYSPGKSPTAIRAVFAAQQRAGQNSLATRITPEQAAAVLEEFPGAEHNPIARTIRVMNAPHQSSRGKVIVVTAGTSDLPVASEARETVEWMGCETDLLIDVGVAGPHRLLQHRQRLETGKAIIVVAGMEGALPSVVAGWVSVPVIAVPTSVGYGASFGGVSALLSMLNSCAANVCVVNIDAGFKGGFLAGLIAGREAHP